MEAGLTGYLRKPVAPDEIVANVRAILERVKYSRLSGQSQLDSTLVG